MTFLVIALFLALFGSLTRPAFDADFWWHLASGRWMWEHRALLREDPFYFMSALPGSPPLDGFELTQYWLSQAAFYGAYLLAGLKGVLVLRAGVFTAMFFLLYRLLRRTGAGMLLVALLLALAVEALARELAYVEIRPQMWSSLFFPALLLLVENLREGKPWARWTLPPFMALWANLHGGYVLGVIVVAVAAAAAHLSRHGERRRILVVAAAAIALSGCNPAGYEALYSYPAWRLSLFGAGPPGIFEETSLFRYVSVSALPRSMPGLAAVLALPLLTLWPRLRNLPRERWDLFLIYLLTLVMGITAQRYLVFLIPTACWTAALNILALRQRLSQARSRPLRFSLPPKIRWALTCAALFALTGAYASMAVRSSGLRARTALSHPSEAAADYLARSGLQGNLFNFYGLGGYLAWRLHPRVKVFIYGRVATAGLLALYNEVVYTPSKTVSLTAAGEVRYFYQTVLDEHSIDAVVIPAGDGRSGDIIPLAMKLAHDDAWALVHAQPTALVFVRNTGALARLAENALAKSEVYDNLIAVASAVARTRHGGSSRVWQRSLALAYDAKGQRAEAVRLFDEYLANSPADAPALRLRNRIASELNIGPR